MSDLISRQAAIDAVNAYLGLSTVSRTIQNMTSVQEILEQLPSAEPEPIKIQIDHELTPEETKELKKMFPDAPIVLLPEQKSGRWIHKLKKLAPLNTICWYECSACGHHAFNGMITDYCPNCGAKMEVEHERPE